MQEQNKDKPLEIPIYVPDILREYTHAGDEVSDSPEERFRKLCEKATKISQMLFEDESMAASLLIIPDLIIAAAQAASVRFMQADAPEKLSKFSNDFKREIEEKLKEACEIMNRDTFRKVIS